ncbi:MAG: glycosyltransferase [Candidatus Rokubacteria bacterium]|nr:glycosyltransferase [Candidatus Rokubacteria bacterium]
MSQPRLLLFVPTYNERHNVERLCAELRGLGLGADLLFVDDNSPDGTGEVLDRLARAHADVRVVHRGGKQGIGTAHRAGIAYAYEHGYDLLVTLDADFSHSPADVPRLIAAHDDDTDVVVGSRFLRGGSLPGWSLHRRLLTMLGHALTTTLLGIPYDASGALRLYDLRRIPRELFELSTAPAYAFFPESLFVLHLNGCRVREVPIVLPARVYGSSKLTIREAARTARSLLRLWFTELVTPERYRRARKIDALRPLDDAQGWNTYWTQATDGIGTAYQAVAALYRRRVLKKNLERWLGRHFPEGAHLLHAGCGSGQLDAHLHRRVRVTAVDISAPALERYARNNPEAYRVEQATVFDLPYDRDAFDGVFNLGVLEHFPGDRIHAMLREFHRVLKPGGKIVVFWPHRFGSSVLFLHGLGRALRVLGRRQPLHPREVSLLRSKRAAVRVLDAAGFRLVDYAFGPRDFFVQSVIVASKE